MSFTERYNWRSMEVHRASKLAASADLSKAPPLARQSSEVERMEQGDRVLLPASALERLMTVFNYSLPSPLTFELQYKGSKCYVGVQEFSGEPGTITLPRAVMTSLALDPKKQWDASEKLSLRYMHLPRAKKVVIQPFTADFLDIPDHRSFMETALTKNFTLLYNNQIVVLRHDGVQYPLLVRGLEPASAPACVIINTDCILELMPPASDGTGTGEDPSRRGIQFLKPGEPVSGWAPEGKYVYYSFALPYAVDPASVDVRVTVTNDDPKAALAAELADPLPPMPGVAALGGAGTATAAAAAAAGGAGDGVHVLGGAGTGGAASSAKADGAVGDADVYISVHPVRKPTLKNHVWALNGVGGGTITLNGDTEDPVPGCPPVTAPPVRKPAGAAAVAAAAAPAAAAAAPAAASGGGDARRSPAASAAAPPTGATGTARSPAAAPALAAAGGAAPRSPAAGTAAPSAGTPSLAERAGTGALDPAALAAQIAARLKLGGPVGDAAAAAVADAAAAAGGGVATAGAGTAAAPAAAGDGGATPAAGTIGALAAAASFTGPRTFYIGVTGYGGRANFTLTVKMVPKGAPADAAAAGAAAAAGDASAGEEPLVPIPPPLDAAAAAASGAAAGGAAAAPADTTGRKQCPHCSAWVLASNYALHSAQCARNNVKCPHEGCGAVLRKGPDTWDHHWHCPTCSAVMPRGLGRKHTLLYHDPHECACGAGPFPLPALRRHMRNDCPRRWVTCRYCEEQVPAGDASGIDRGLAAAGYTAHEIFCGGVSGVCSHCGLKLKRQDNAEHCIMMHPHLPVVPLVPEDIASSSGAWVPPSGYPRPGSDVSGGGGSGGGGGRYSRSGSTDSGGEYGGYGSSGRSSPTISAPVPAGPVLPPNWQRQWACGTCTFGNTVGRLSCDICGSDRPAAPAWKVIDMARGTGEDVAAAALAAAGFLPDGSPDPAALAAAAAAAPAVLPRRPTGGADYSGISSRSTAAAAPSGPWVCGTCTYENGASRSTCEMCGAAKPPPAAAAPATAAAGGDGGTPSRGGISGLLASAAAALGFGGASTAAAPAAAASSSSAAVHVPGVRTGPIRADGGALCRNAVCANMASKGAGDAAAKGVCERCHAIMTDDGTATDADDFSECLMRLYQRQAVEGCGRATCRNPHCATAREAAAAAAPASAAAARPALKRAPSVSEEVMGAMLETGLWGTGTVSGTGARVTPKYYVCVPDRQRLDVKVGTGSELAERLAAAAPAVSAAAAGAMGLGGASASGGGGGGDDDGMDVDEGGATTPVVEAAGDGSDGGAAATAATPAATAAAAPTAAAWTAPAAAVDAPAAAAAAAAVSPDDARRASAAAAARARAAAAARDSKSRVAGAFFP